MGDASEPEALFGELAAPSLAQAGVTRSTMMGYPCLRLSGEFFAGFDRRKGRLIVKLDEAHVDELVDRGRAEPFAPNGRRFRQWAAVPYEARDSWADQLDAALAARAWRFGGRG